MSNTIMHITFSNSPKDATENFYSRFNNQDLQRALQTLSCKAFRLYIYFGMFKERHSFEFSRQDAISTTGLSLRSYTNAMHELKQKGYISTGTKSYHFRYSEKGEPINH